MPPDALNRAQPRVMHIDLNSAFATTEQQARPSLRGKAMGVTNRISRHCCIIAASYEAKALGIKVGMRLDEARMIAPDFVILESDPPKYHHMYKKLVAIMKDYSPAVEMKSIDEGVIDFTGTEEHNNHRSLISIGYDIKQRVREEVGDWMRINIGIGPNRFLAKQAAGWHKPDGLDQLDWRSIRRYYKSIVLTDLSGIAAQNQARLQAAGIYTPLDFLKTPADVLRKKVFKSVVGEDWHQRLRGYEVDDYATHLGSVGRQFVLDVREYSDDDITSRFHYLCETTAKKLRYRGVDARGVLVWAYLQSGEQWYVRKMYKSRFYTDAEVYRRALQLFSQRPMHSPVRSMGVTCYQLAPSRRSQVSLFEAQNKAEWLTQSVDEINERYGMCAIASAHSFMAHGVVGQKIPFGGTQYFSLLLQS